MSTTPHADPLRAAVRELLQVSGAPGLLAAVRAAAVGDVDPETAAAYDAVRSAAAGAGIEGPGTACDGAVDAAEEFVTAVRAVLTVSPAVARRTFT